MKKLLIASIFVTISAASFAVNAEQATKVVPLKNGSTVHIFSDGKMAMEDKYGRAVRMQEGEVMEAQDGQKIVMRGDEVSRLDMQLRKVHGVDG